MPRQEWNAYEKHILGGGPRLDDYVMTNGVLPDGALDDYLKARKTWEDEERRLRAIYRPSSSTRD